MNIKVENASVALSFQGAKLKKNQSLRFELHGKLKWDSHIQSDKATTHKRIWKRLRALKFISKHVAGDRRVILVNGLDCLRNIVVRSQSNEISAKTTQSLQSQAGIWALNVNRRASTVNWLSVCQLVIFHSMTLLWQQGLENTDFMTRDIQWEVSRTHGSERLRTQPYRMEFKRKAWKYKAI